MQEALSAAAVLLGCREGATPREVRIAYRLTLHAGRPDTGGADGVWVQRVQAARDLLLEHAAPERRRRARGELGPQAYLPLRRATWTVELPRGPRVDVRL